MSEGDVTGSSPIQFSEAILDHLLEGFQLIGFDWTYLYVNDAVARQGRLSKKELLGRKMTDVYPGIENTAMFALLQQCMADRVPLRMENEFEFADGQKGWFELVMEPVPAGVFILSSDITEKKRAQAAEAHMERQMRQAQKMDAIGNLASGIVHDFNNVMSVILSYTSSMEADLAPDDSMRQDLAEIRMAADLATGLTRQLLAFSRNQVIEPSVLDINQVVSRMEEMLRRLVGDSIAIEVRRHAELDTVLADAHQLEQVLFNLVLNACDAMPGGGKVTVETANLFLDGDYVSSHLGVLPGDYVMLSVTDTGFGMTPETQERILEPFFTTKEKGKGTGLGLPTVYGIIRQAGGHMWIYSEPGQGSIFKIYLPSHVAKAAPVPTKKPDAETMQGSETILIVDNDAQVLKAATDILTKHGYRVIAESNTDEVLRLVERNEQGLSLLLTDVMMPGMNGVELAQKVKALLPHLKIMYMSGYSREMVMRHGLPAADLDFIQKPLLREALLQQIRRSLDL